MARYYGLNADQLVEKLSEIRSFVEETLQDQAISDYFEHLNDQTFKALKEATSNEDLTERVQPILSEIAFIRDLFVRHGALNTGGKGTDIFAHIVRIGAFERAVFAVRLPIHDVIDEHLSLFSKPTDEEVNEVLLPVYLDNIYVKRYGIMCDQSEKDQVMDLIIPTLMPYQKIGENSMIGYGLIDVASSDQDKVGVIFDGSENAAYAIHKALKGTKFSVLDANGKPIADPKRKASPQTKPRRRLRLS